MARDSQHETTQRTMHSDGPARPTPRSACVVVIHGANLGRRADIDEAPVLVGRSQEADLSIAHKSVSREHCRIWREGKAYFIRDLGATNPTRVNDRRIDGDAILADGDQVTVGGCILKFISQDSVEAQYHEEIYQLATHDALTELCNRRHFTELADKEIARALRHARPLSLCILDVDLFKPVNDRYGHNSGDEVLRQIGALVRRHARSDDLPARIGGEEFALFLPNTGKEATLLFAQTLRATRAVAPIPGLPPGVRITASFGVAEVMRGEPLRFAMRRADDALYAAKNAGRDCVREAEPAAVVLEVVRRAT